MATDKCPGNLIDMALDTSVSLQGTTVGATDDYKEFCGDTKAAGMGSPDVVYQFKVENRCSFFLNLSALGPSWNPVAAIRQVCDTRNAGADLCISGLTGGQTFKGELQAGTYSVIIDGDGSINGGAFTLNLQCLTPKCGDGVLNTAEEQCDLGPNPPANSGCGAPGTPNACKLLPTPAADTCGDIASTPAATISIGMTGTTPVVLPAMDPTFDTRVANNDYIASCSVPAISGGPGLDQVFAFQPTATGKLSVNIGKDRQGTEICAAPYDQPGCWQHVMWFQSTCAKQVLATGCKQTGEACTAVTDCCAPVTNGGTCAGPAGAMVCSGGYGMELPPTGSTMLQGSGCVQSDVATNYDSTITIDVTAGQTYYLFVQGQTTDRLIIGENGPYYLRATLTP
jgi:hypothetical protein